MVDEEGGGAWQELLPSLPLPNDNPDEARLLRLRIKPSKCENPKRRRGLSSRWVHCNLICKNYTSTGLSDPGRWPRIRSGPYKVRTV